MCKQMPSCFSFSQRRDISSIKNLCMEQTSLFIGVREFKEDPVTHCCRKSHFRMQESGENVFTSVLSSVSLILKSPGDRKSQKSAGIALIQNWPVTRFSHSSPHADSSMQKSQINIKFSIILMFILGLALFFFSECSQNNVFLAARSFVTQCTNSYQ